MRKHEQVEKYINDALQALNSIMHTKQPDRPSLPEDQLIRFKTNLQQMSERIKSGKIPPPSDRPNFMGRIIADSWPLDLPAANLIILAERSFLEL